MAHYPTFNPAHRYDLVAQPGGTTAIRDLDAEPDVQTAHFYVNAEAVEHHFNVWRDTEGGTLYFRNEDWGLTTVKELYRPDPEPAAEPVTISRDGVTLVERVNDRFDIVTGVANDYTTLVDHEHKLVYNGYMPDVRSWVELETRPQSNMLAGLYGFEHLYDRANLRDLMVPQEELVEWEKALMEPVPAPEPERDYKAELEALWAALGERANEEMWCEQYDIFAEKHGGPKRPKQKYTGNVRVGLLIPVEYEEDADPNSEYDALSSREKRDLIKSALGKKLKDMGLTDAQLSDIAVELHYSIDLTRQVPHYTTA